MQYLIDNRSPRLLALAKHEVIEYLGRSKNAMASLLHSVSEALPGVNAGNGNIKTGLEILMLAKAYYYLVGDLAQAEYYFRCSVTCFNKKSTARHNFFEALCWYTSVVFQTEIETGKKGAYPLRNLLLSALKVTDCSLKQQQPLLEELAHITITLAVRGGEVDLAIFEKLVASQVSFWSLLGLKTALEKSNIEPSVDVLKLLTQISQHLSNTNERLKIPTTKRLLITEEIHGIKIEDPYRWLEEDNPRRKEWVERQSKAADALLSSTAKPTELLLDRKDEFVSIASLCPQRAGDRLFYRTQDEHVMTLRKWGQFPKRILSSKKGDQIHFHMNSDGTKLLCGTYKVGGDWLKWNVRDVSTTCDTAQTFSATCAMFMPNGDVIYRKNSKSTDSCSIYLKKKRAKKAIKLQTIPLAFYPMWKKISDALCLGLSVLSDTRNQNNRILYADLREREPHFIEVLPGNAEHIFVGANSTKLYFITDRDAPRRKLVSVDRNNFKESVEIPENRDTLVFVRVFESGYLAEYFKDAETKLRWISKNKQREIKLPFPCATIADSEIFGANSITLMLESMGRRQAIFKLSLNSLKFSPLTPRVVPKTRFKVRRLRLKSADGTPVVLFIAHLEGLKIDADTPTLLTAYGGYGKYWTPQHFWLDDAWMAQGGICARAIIRGGGEYGTDWHYDGCREKQQNSCDDFIACMRHLVKEGYTTPSRLAVRSKSKGGLLVATAVTQHPELFGAACITAPIADLMRWQHFEPSETSKIYNGAEIGRPSDRPMTTALLKTSPVHNARAAQYPPILIQTGDQDKICNPFNSYKLAAALQQSQTGLAPIIVKTYIGEGHEYSYNQTEDGIRFLATTVGLV